MKRYVLTVVLMGILFSACSNKSVQNAPVEIQAEAVILDTSTLLPTLTLTPTLTPSPTPTIPPAIATVLKAQEACEPQVFYLDYTIQRSPDGRWTAIVCETDTSRTIISNTTSDLEWIIPANFYEFDTGERWGPELAMPYLWSKDGRYLYFSHYIFS